MICSKCGESISIVGEICPYCGNCLPAPSPPSPLVAVSAALPVLHHRHVKHVLVARPRDEQLQLLSRERREKSLGFVEPLAIDQVHGIEPEPPRTNRSWEPCLRELLTPLPDT